MAQQFNQNSNESQTSMGGQGVPVKKQDKTMTERERLQQSLKQTLTEFKQAHAAKKERENGQASQGGQKGTAQTNNRQIGNYIVGRTIGQGTFGKVRLGTHTLTQEKVAIKILEKEKIKDQSDVTRVMREIHILKVVRHPNIVQLYEIIETSRQLFLIMEFAPGGELFDYIVKKKRLQDREACRFFHQILAGIEYLHKNKVCHRDLKPENLLLDENMNIKIVDFGLSNTYKNPQDTLKTACGSPCYASPEMIAGKLYLGLDTDIWSLGVILYAMTVGYLPFEDPDTNKLYKKILNCDYLVPGYVEKPAKDMMKRIMQVDPKKRYNIEAIKTHPWFVQLQQPQLDGIIIGTDQIPVLDQIQLEMEGSSNIQSLEGIDRLAQQVRMNKHNPITATYYLLIKKYERNTDQNLVFGKFTRDKRLQEQQRNSTSSSSKNFNQGIMLQTQPRGISNSIAVIQENYGGLDPSLKKQSQPKSEQKFRSQTNEAANRNKKIDGTQITVVPNTTSQRTRVAGQNRSKAVQQFLESTIGKNSVNESQYTSMPGTAHSKGPLSQNQHMMNQSNGLQMAIRNPHDSAKSGNTSKYHSTIYSQQARQKNLRINRNNIPVIQLNQKGQAIVLGQNKNQQVLSESSFMHERATSVDHHRPQARSVIDANKNNALKLNEFLPKVGSMPPTQKQTTMNSTQFYTQSNAAQSVQNGVQLSKAGTTITSDNLGIQLANQKQTQSGDMQNRPFDSIKGSTGANNMSVIVQGSNIPRKIPLTKHKANLGTKQRITGYNFYQQSNKMDKSSVMLENKSQVLDPDSPPPMHKSNQHGKATAKMNFQNHTIYAQEGQGRGTNAAFEVFGPNNRQSPTRSSPKQINGFPVTKANKINQNGVINPSVTFYKQKMFGGGSIQNAHATQHNDRQTQQQMVGVGEYINIGRLPTQNGSQRVPKNANSPTAQVYMSTDAKSGSSALQSYMKGRGTSKETKQNYTTQTMFKPRVGASVGVNANLIQPNVTLKKNNNFMSQRTGNQAHAHHMGVPSSHLVQPNPRTSQSNEVYQLNASGVTRKGQLDQSRASEQEMRLPYQNQNFTVYNSRAANTKSGSSEPWVGVALKKHGGNSGKQNIKVGRKAPLPL